LRFPASQYILDLARSPRNITACAASQRPNRLRLASLLPSIFCCVVDNEACPASYCTLRGEPPRRNDLLGRVCPAKSPIEVLSADHQNKKDIAAAPARE